MAERTFKLPDIGEGIAEAELADWLVRGGDMVQEDDPICEVTTDKATVEIPASATGRVTWLAGSPGEIIAIGGDLIRIETEGAPDSAAAADPVKAPEPARAEPRAAEPQTPPAPAPARIPRPSRPVAPDLALNASGRPLAAPSVRARAREKGIDLRRVRGSGPAGRILHEDLEDFIAHGPALPAAGRAPRTAAPAAACGQSGRELGPAPCTRRDRARADDRPARAQPRLRLCDARHCARARRRAGRTGAAAGHGQAAPAGIARATRARGDPRGGERLAGRFAPCERHRRRPRRAPSPWGRRCPLRYST